MIKTGDEGDGTMELKVLTYIYNTSYSTSLAGLTVAYITTDNLS